MAHVLFAVFGSGGDMFPSIAVANAVRRQGHRVTILSPPSAGLYARTAGLATATIGDGAELRVMADEAVYTTRFDGFSSWRRTAAHYLAPLLGAAYDRALRTMARLAPDLVVVHPLAPFGSLLATELGIPWASLHLYPQLVPPAATGRLVNFGGPLARLLRDRERAAGLPPSDHPLLRRGWAETTNLSVHDPVVVAGTELATGRIGRPCGFPYWDLVPAPADDVHVAEQAVAGDRAPIVATLGSFIGRSQDAFWTALADAVTAQSLPALFLGAPPELRPRLEAAGDITCCGFVPLSSIAARARLVVHHGGIGTTYAALLAGVPALIVPQAFDQPFNGRLVEQLGTGRTVTDPHELSPALTAMLVDDRHAERARALAGVLRSPADAADTIATALLTEVAASVGPDR